MMLRGSELGLSSVGSALRGRDTQQRPEWGTTSWVSGCAVIQTYFEWRRPLFVIGGMGWSRRCWSRCWRWRWQLRNIWEGRLKSSSQSVVSAVGPTLLKAYVGSLKISTLSILPVFSKLTKRLLLMRPSRLFQGWRPLVVKAEARRCPKINSGASPAST